MGTMLETIENAIISEPDPISNFRPAVAQDEVALEDQLAQEITGLWGKHLLLSADRKAAAKELRQIRARLAERLYEMKSLLSRPGRGGEWRGWLRERGIPRSSADRLCDRHAETLGSHDEVAPTGAISEPSEADVERWFRSLWPGLRKKLSTPWLAYEFLFWIVGSFDLPHEEKDNGLWVADPRVKSSSAAPPAQVPTEAVACAGDGDSGEVMQ
jgi:hypothetical protein